MFSKKPSSSLYPQVDQTNPDSNPPSKNPSSSSPSLYPAVEMDDLAANLFPETEEEKRGETAAAFESSEEVLVTIPGVIVHLIDRDRSVELASGVFTVVQLRQGGNVVAALTRVGEEIQWPLAKDEAAVKLDESHYFFILRVPAESGGDGDNQLNYGLTNRDEMRLRVAEIDEMRVRGVAVMRVSEMRDGLGLILDWVLILIGLGFVFNWV